MFDKLYNRSPVWIQEYLLALRGRAKMAVRENAQFRALLREAEARQYWTAEQLQQWQGAQLDTLLQRVEDVVPYYRRESGSEASLATSAFARLAAYPLLTKPQVVVVTEDFIAEDLRSKRRFAGSTSGTTGMPLKLYQTAEAIRRENAFVWRQMHWAGYRQGERRVWLRGEMVVPGGGAAAPFWRRNRAENMLMMSAYHLSDAAAQGYLDAMRSFDPALIQAYPSAISFLANWLWDRGATIRIPSLKGIMTSSETLLADQRARIEHTFGVRVFDWYGSFERVSAIGTCEHGRYHVIEDYGYTEFIPKDDGTAEIVSTGFNNELMPLVRYASGDAVELEEPGFACECGRRFRVVRRVLGRMDDAIKTPDGRRITRLGHIYKGVEGLAEGQIVQNRTDVVEIRVVATAGEALPATSHARLLQNMRDRIGQDMEVRIVQVDRLDRTKNGKLRTVVCTV